MSSVDLPTTTFRARGLEEAVEILVDRHGIPHIYARSEHDLFFAQGFNAARDRLFQLDLWRRTGRGLLAEAFGPEFVERDRLSRLFSYRGDLAADLSRYGHDAKARLQSFVAGINAYVDQVAATPELLPFEFRLLDYEPGRFDVADIVCNRTTAAVGNVADEVLRARTLARFGPEVDDLRRCREPHRDLEHPSGFPLDRIPDDVVDEVLRVLQVLSAPVVLPVPRSGEPSTPPPPARLVDGSNNWVVAGGRTPTGRAVLASDPHRNLGVPSLRYVAHLSCPGIDLIGAGEPSLPGVAIGHNGKVAFGLTIFPGDQEDLYCYETEVGDPRRYRYGEGGEPMRVVREQVPVRGAPDADIELVYTRHGPVVYEDAARHVAFAIRSVRLEPGGAPYLAGLGFDRPGNVHEMLDMLDRWTTPGENFVCADTAGNTAWRAACHVPRRRNWDGLLPVPGDGSYEWDGFYGSHEMPRTVNPDSGYLVTANSRSLPDDLSPEVKLGFEFPAPFRRDRVAEVLASERQLTIEQHVALQNDHVSPLARGVANLARALAGTAAAAGLEEAIDLFTGFDGELGATPAAALYEVWFRTHLRRALLRWALSAHVGEHEIDEALSMALGASAFVYGKGTLVDARLVSEAENALRAGDAGISGVIAGTLRAAVDELRDTFHGGPETWSWAALHRATVAHPLAQHPDAPPGLVFGPVSRTGDGDTIGCTTAGADHVQFHGADFRVVIDVGDWDRALVMNAPGQSGDPRSPHFGDLFPLWAEDRAVPLVYTRAAVEEAAEARLLLAPVRSDPHRP